ncbi:unnamed protein product [Hyaloperonospora brassicae]|uniref:FYVE-type domain-containing protein n=1 Tax=Hyaloperonospora brassicae TaxID=162125 RepID=A0AAV0U855_HYABA|nr:unnamed protein product [Hyaloperonospora brassicae]
MYPPEPLTLSAEDERTIESLADRLVVETLHASERFAVRGQTVDPTRWKLLKKKDSIVVYQELPGARARDRLWSKDTVVLSASRPLTPQSGYTTPSTGGHVLPVADHDDLEKSRTSTAFASFGARTSAEDDDSVLRRFQPADVPTVCSAGTFPGSMEDMALAFFADSDARTRTRFTSNKDVAVDDMRILARLQGPSAADPFRFLGIKWCTNAPRILVALVVKPRDYLIIESTGMALDANGERFCYMLNHSIALAAVPDFRAFGLVRTVFSACHIMRRPSALNDAVRIFSRGFLLINGRFSVRSSAAQFAEGLAVVPRMVEEAYSTKLAWLMETAQARSHTSSSGHATADHNNSSFGSSSFGSSSVGSRSTRGSKTAAEKSSLCSCCHVKLLSVRLSSLVSTSRGECRLCHQIVCYKCTVKKLLPLEGARGRQVKTRELEFCLDCYLKAKRLSAWHVALAMLNTPLPSCSTDVPQANR